jgi:hypothetical protein
MDEDDSMLLYTVALGRENVVRRTEDQVTKLSLRNTP